MIIKEETLETKLDEFSRCEELAWEQPEDGTSRHIPDKADAVLEERISHALWKNEVLRATDNDEIEIHVRDSVAYLLGYLTSRTNRARIDKALQSVEGLRGVRNELVIDDELMLEVASSLAELEHKYQCKFFTGVSHGVVGLNGEVDSLEARKDAELRAASNPHVRGVINYIHVPGLEVDEQSHRFLQPSIGSEICFRDGPIGTVQQVVINPDNRLVIGLTIKGITVDSYKSPQEFLVIPMSVMDHLTNNSGFLSIRSTDDTKYQKFEAAKFVTPGEDWTPPYPYCPNDVLIPVEFEQSASMQGKPHPAPAERKTGEDILKEEIHANDSLGG